MADIDINKKYTKKQCDSINNQYQEYYMNDISVRVTDLEKCQVLTAEQHKTVLEKMVEGFNHIETTLQEVIKHQKHTNGDVSQLKIWRAGLAGGLAVILACGGFITTFFFLERSEQRNNNNQVIILGQQVSMLNDKLKDLELAD